MGYRQAGAFEFNCAIPWVQLSNEFDNCALCNLFEKCL